MAPQKTNFKTYESATRLLAAVIATTNPKLNFNAIAEHMGKDQTGSAVDHRLRPIKQLAKLQAQCVESGNDPGELPIEKGEIQKLFGESTPDGLEFQFRSIKKLGIAQKAAVEKGEDPSKIAVGGTGTGTPRANRVSTASTPGSRKRSTAAKTPTSKRVRPKKEEAGSDDESNDSDGDTKDAETPTHKKPKIEGQSTAATPRAAASNGNTGNIGNPGNTGSSFASTHTATNSANVDESFASAVGPPSATSSLFGDGSRPSNSFAAPSPSATSSFFRDRTRPSNSFAVPPPKDNAMTYVKGQGYDDDDVVEIDGSQFSQTQSFSRKPATKQGHEDQSQTSFSHGLSDSYITTDQAGQSFYNSQLDEDEV